MEPQRCKVHGVVLQADGSCVICKRDKGERPLVEPSSSGAMLGLVIGVIVVLAVCMVGYRLLNDDEVTPIASDAVAAPVEAEPTEEAAQPPAPSPRRPPFSTRRNDGTDEPASPGATEAELERARKQVSITMYSTSWCEVCAQARRWFRDQGLQVRDLDVEASETDAIEHRALNAKGSVPTLQIDGKVLIGFSAQRVDDELHAAAERRLQR